MYKKGYEFVFVAYKEFNILRRYRILFSVTLTHRSIGLRVQIQQGQNGERSLGVMVKLPGFVNGPFNRVPHVSNTPFK